MHEAEGPPEEPSASPDPGADAAERRVMRLRLPLRHHMLLQRIRILEGVPPSRAVAEAIELYLRQRFPHLNEELQEGPGKE